MWQVAVLAGTAAVATQLVGEQRAEEAQRQSLVVLDETTGLYSRAYFLRALGAEVRRAQRDDRPLHVILIDIDHFGEFNRRFGIETGDALLKLIAKRSTECVSEAGDVTITTNLAARFGGEEFVVLFAEDETIDGPPQSADALAPRRAASHRHRRDHRRRRGSHGLDRASHRCPDDGTSADELLDAADAALALAVEEGGDRVALARRSRRGSSRTSSRPSRRADLPAGRLTCGASRRGWSGLALAVFLLGASVVPLTIPAFTRLAASRTSLPRRPGCRRSACSRSPSRSACSWSTDDGDTLPATVDGRAGFDAAAVSHLLDVRRVSRLPRGS